MKLLDTCFLVDLHRELRARTEGPAQGYLEANEQESFGISVISVTEFLEGFAKPKDGEILLRPFHWFDVEATVSGIAAGIRRDLRMRGQLIGDFDILIAATALAEKITLVTNNTAHFGRISGLMTENY